MFRKICEINFGIFEELRKSDLFQVGVEYMTSKGKAPVHHFVFDPTDSITLKYVVFGDNKDNFFNAPPENVKRITEIYQSNTKKMNAYAAWRAASRDGWSKELEDIVVYDAQHAFLFARDIKGANILRLEDAVIALDNGPWILDFAVDIPAANTKKLERAIIDKASPKIAYWFAKNVPGANISDIVDYVLVKEPEWIRQLFDVRPDLKQKYELGEIRSIVRAALE